MPEKTLDLKRIAIGNSTVVLTYRDFVTDAAGNVYPKDTVETCKAPATFDFRNAVKRMNDYVYHHYPLKKDEVESLKVTSISIKNEDDGCGITMAVTAQFKDVSRPANFNTPYWSTLDNQNPMPDEVSETLEVIKAQAKLYSDGKYEQASLDLTAEEKPEALPKSTQKSKQKSEKAMAVAI